MLVPKWPFIWYIHYINECTVYRDMLLAAAQSPTNSLDGAITRDPAAPVYCQSEATGNLNMPGPILQAIWPSQAKGNEFLKPT